MVYKEIIMLLLATIAGKEKAKRKSKKNQKKKCS